MALRAGPTQHFFPGTLPLPGRPGLEARDPHSGCSVQPAGWRRRGPGFWKRQTAAAPQEQGSHGFCLLLLGSLGLPAVGTSGLGEERGRLREKGGLCAAPKARFPVAETGWKEPPS